MTVNHQSRLGVCVCLPARPAETLPYVWNYVSACRSHHFTTSASPVMMVEKLPGNHLSLSALIPFIVLPFPVSMAAVLAVIFRCTPVLACTALTHRPLCTPWLLFSERTYSHTIGWFHTVNITGWSFPAISVNLWFETTGYLYIRQRLELRRWRCRLNCWQLD